MRRVREKMTQFPYKTITTITSLVRNFLKTGTIPGHEGRESSIVACVDSVDIQTDTIDKNKKIDMSSIETWYNNYVQNKVI